MNPPPPARLPRGPFVLIGLMTVTTVLGPFLIGWVLRGGASRRWPPDRPVEWVTLLGTSGAVILLMLACLLVGFLNRKPSAHVAAARNRAESASGPGVPGEVIL